MEKGTGRMALFREDIAEIQTRLQGVIGKKAWGVKHGIGTFVTIEFGQPMPPKYPNGKSHGEWHLWVYGGAWRLEKGAQVVVASEDDQQRLKRISDVLKGVSFNHLRS